MACRNGCTDCCSNISVFPIEAVVIHQGFLKLDEKMRVALEQRAQMLKPKGICPLLDNGVCLLYDDRPIICRMAGFPCIIVRDGRREIECCPLNFQQAVPLSQDDVIDADLVNNMLWMINTEFCESVFADNVQVPARLTISQALVSDFLRNLSVSEHPDRLFREKEAE